MKKLSIIIGAFLVLTSSIAFAENYVGFTVGGVFPQELEVDRKDDDMVVYDMDLSNGGMFGVKFGHIFAGTGNVFAMELEGFRIKGTDIEHELAYLHPDPPNPPVYADADISIDALMLNFIIRSPSDDVHPYFGVGFGVAHIDIEDTAYILPEGNIWIETGTRYLPQDDEHDDAFAGQILAGVDIDIVDGLSLDFGGRYFYTEPEFENTEMVYQAWMLTFGVDILF